MLAVNLKKIQRCDLNLSRLKVICRILVGVLLVIFDICEYNMSEFVEVILLRSPSQMRRANQKGLYFYAYR